MNYTINNIHPVNNLEYFNIPSIDDRNTLYYFRGNNNNINRSYNALSPNNTTINYDSSSYNNQYKNLFDNQHFLLKDIIRHSDDSNYRTINYNTMSIPINILNPKSQINPRSPKPIRKNFFPQVKNNIKKMIPIAKVTPIVQDNKQPQQKVTLNPNIMIAKVTPIPNPNANNDKAKVIKITDNKDSKEAKKDIEINNLKNDINNNEFNPKVKNDKINNNIKQPNDNIKQKELISNNQINNPSPKAINNNIKNQTQNSNIIPSKNNINDNNQKIIIINPQSINNNNPNLIEIKQIINSPQNNNRINPKVIIQNNNINAPQDNNKTINNKNINNIQQQNIATVRKINNDNNNILPNTSPIIKKSLDNRDFNNIIYKEIGMINLGNTCFINSCLQVLIHCPFFIYNFFRQMRSIDINETIISAYFYQLCLTMMNTINTQEKYIDITNFRGVFGAKHPTFEGYLQNDSQEFCRIFLQDINEELNIVKNKELYKVLTNTDRKTKITRDREFDLNFKGREHSIITDLFYSQIITTYTCECKGAIYAFQKLLDFPLLLRENMKTIDIYNLLRIYFQDEIIDFEKQCEKCKKVSKHKKVIKISRPPTILILSLQRIDPITQKKNECIVTFPKVLDMSEFLDHDCGFDTQPYYDLYAVVNHIGNINVGHYFSYIKFHQRKDWYEFNDSSVKNIGNNIESFPYAYALFYIKNDRFKM